jgi:hypothetical protein
MDSLATSALNRPKMSHTTLEIRKNYYVIPDGEQFHYFPIKVLDEKTSRDIFRLEKTPPVIIEGIAILDNKLYHVSVKDLMRGVIRKSKEIKPANRVTENGSSTNSSHNSGTTDPSTEASTGSIRGTDGTNLRSNDEQGSLSASEMEVNRAANLAWSEQIDSLLSFISEKEGGQWEVTSVAQP